MGLLAPAALGLGLLALPIILLYMLRLRRREQIVSSTYLWRELVRDQAANIPWQRLRRNLLLFLQLLILAFLVLALARPYLRLGNGTSSNTFILLDASASMQATDMPNGRSRFDLAREEAKQFLGGGPVTLIQVGKTPFFLTGSTTDRQELQKALDASLPENSIADWQAAIALANASSQGIRDPQFVIISDGGLPESMATLPGETRFVSVGRDDQNLAITAMASRASPEGEVVFVSVHNTGSNDQSAILSLYSDSRLMDSQRLTITAEGREYINFILPPGSGVIEARLEPSERSSDYLALDNRAWVIPSGNDQQRILLVSDGNLFLERFFNILPGYEVVRASVDESSGIIVDNETSGSQFDLIVFDSMPLPAELPDTNILAINPQPSDLSETINTGSLFGEISIQVGQTITDTTATRISSDPLVENVDWDTVNINQTHSIKAEQLKPIIESQSGPLLLAGEDNGRRIVIIPFDLRQSDLPVQIAFPILMTNIVSWLSPGGIVATAGTLQPGDPVTLIPDTQAEGIVIDKPDGSRWEELVNNNSRTLLFSQTDQTGPYRVSYRNPSGELLTAGFFPVNFFSRDESQIKPAESIQIGQLVLASATGTTTSRQEIWPWLLVLAFVILFIEWWISFPIKLRKPLIKMQ